MTPAEHKQTLALAAMAVTVVVWGCSSVAIKLVSTSGLVASFYRLWLAIPLLWLIALLVPRIRRRLDRRWLIDSAAGGSLFAIHQVFFFTGLKATTVANLTIIGALQPALVLVLAGPIFGEAVTARSLLWSLVALTGTAIVVFGPAREPTWNPAGIALAVGNLFTFTAYFLASKRIRSRQGAAEYVVGMTTVAGILMLAVCLASSQDLASPRGWDVPILLAIALLPGTLGHFLSNWAHRHTSAFAMSIMILAVPVIASAGAAMFLDEYLGLPEITGGAIVLLAIGSVIASAHPRTAGELARSAAGTDAP